PPSGCQHLPRRSSCCLHRRGPARTRKAAPLARSQPCESFPLFAPSPPGVLIIHQTSAAKLRISDDHSGRHSPACLGTLSLSSKLRRRNYVSLECPPAGEVAWV